MPHADRPADGADVIGVGRPLRHARHHSARHDSTLVDSLFAALKSVPVPQRVTALDATQATLGDCDPSSNPVSLHRTSADRAIYRRLVTSGELLMACTHQLRFLGSG